MDLLFLDEDIHITIFLYTIQLCYCETSNTYEAQRTMTKDIILPSKNEVDRKTKVLPIKCIYA